jgi:uncharacterized protein
MIPRSGMMDRLRTGLRRSPVVALVGPRQCGKTTLARQLVSPESENYFDLEDPRDLARLDEPITALEPLRGMVALDEIQRRPELFPILRVLADRPDQRARFLVLGSASPELLRQSTETLAGRIETVALGGFHLLEVGPGNLDFLWERGGFPRSFLAESTEDSFEWRDQFLRTFLERDLPAMGIGIPPVTMLRFWTMLAHYHGQTWNGAELARSLGVGETSVRRYLDLLTGLFMVRQLPPWHANLSKRQVKSPKVYLRDTGLLHALLGIRTAGDLLRHPRFGASWEGFALEQVVLALRPDQAYFWGTHSGAELDLLLFLGPARFGFEFKRQDAPRATPSMLAAQNDLELSHLFVVYPGARTYAIRRGISALPLAAVADPPALRAAVLSHTGQAF